MRTASESLPPALRRALAGLLHEALTELRPDEPRRDRARFALALLEALTGSDPATVPFVPLARLVETAAALHVRRGSPGSAASPASPEAWERQATDGLARLAAAGLIDLPDRSGPERKVTLLSPAHRVQRAVHAHTIAYRGALETAARLGDEVRGAMRPLAEVETLFDAGLYFEVHEILEAEWHCAAGAERQLLQGLIQLAVAFHHYDRGNRRGAHRLLRVARDRLRSAGPTTMGLDIDAVVAATTRWIEFIDTGKGAGVDPPTPPARPRLRSYRHRP